ncbi:MAG: Nif3-like dinuclear metal center hexameric protein [Bacteroidales bacterium]|jgi:dinuclear metal center YbgI/SA1388 family protein|nr:Nif3-like dinuclear metal center hexameric protein [Bacteroidales bacterium]
MRLLAADIIEVLEQWAPWELQEEWDNSGLCIGNPATPVSGILVCLDCTPEVVEEAISGGLNMIISHHPLIFKGLKSLKDTTPVERTVARAIRGNLVVYSIHTNADKIMDGVSGAMGRALNLQNISILAPESCLNRDAAPCGLGVVGDLEQPMLTEDFFNLLKTTFSLQHFKASVPFQRQVSRIALCGGSGSSLIPYALRSGAGVYVSADFNYHSYFETVPQIMLADIGHYESEAGVQDQIVNQLIKKFPTFAVRKTEIFTNPIRYY